MAVLHPRGGSVVSIERSRRRVLRQASIRQAQRGDAAVLARAEAETARTPGLLVQRPGEIPAKAFAAKITALKKSGLYIVAEEDGKVVGHAFLDPMGLAAARHVFLLNIVVHPGFQGRGIGAALMSHLMDWARTDPRVGKIELLVRAANERARHLYHRFGFREEGRFRGRIQLPDGDLVDDIAMACFPKRATRKRKVLGSRGLR